MFEHWSDSELDRNIKAESLLVHAAVRAGVPASAVDANLVVLERVRDDRARRAAARRRRDRWDSVAGPIPEAATQVVYQLLDTHQRVVYVGITDNLRTRLRAHRRDGKRFSGWVATRTEDRATAAAAERVLIEHLRPPMNVRLNPDRVTAE